MFKINPLTDESNILEEAKKNEPVVAHTQPAGPIPQTTPETPLTTSPVQSPLIDEPSHVEVSHVASVTTHKPEIIMNFKADQTERPNNRLAPASYILGTIYLYIGVASLISWITMQIVYMALYGGAYGAKIDHSQGEFNLALLQPFFYGTIGLFIFSGKAILRLFATVMLAGLALYMGYLLVHALAGSKLSPGASYYQSNAVAGYMLLGMLPYVGSVLMSVISAIILNTRRVSKYYE
jgi:uncharacterized membrane protein YkgB